MAQLFMVRTRNYNKPPTAEQRKVMEVAWGGEVPYPEPRTRIEVHLCIKTALKDPVRGRERKLKLKLWRADRKAARLARRQERARIANGGAPRA